MNYAIQKNSRRSLLIAAALMCSVQLGNFDNQFSFLFM